MLSAREMISTQQQQQKQVAFAKKELDTLTF
jgi:hypothetical protein